MTFKRIIAIIIGLFLIYIFANLISLQNAKGDDIEGKVKTVYDINGRPINQSQDAKGFHRVTGSVKLVDGKATITLNTNIAEGRQDISFINKYTYWGRVSVSDTSNTNTYEVYPQSGTQFIILSSSSTDTNTVNYLVEGE